MSYTCSYTSSTRLRPGEVPALFLHIQKTGGTSIVQVARRYYQSVTSHGDCWGYPPERFRDTKFVSGHFGYDYARHLMEGRFSFTFLRDPVERILSMYFFWRSQDPEAFDIYRAAHCMELADFLKAGFTDHLVRKNIWNGQVWQLAHGYAHLDDRSIEDFEPNALLDMAMEHLDRFSFVGVTERFEEDKAVVLSVLGIPNERVHANRTAGRPRVEPIYSGYARSSLSLTGPFTGRRCTAVREANPRIWLLRDRRKPRQK